MLSEFGRYLILKKIAVGGMAEIFLARRVSMSHFSKFVVLKRLSPEYQGKKSFERLFLMEAKLTGRLSHPNIVQLHDLGQVDGSYFMAMEYIHGVSSAEMMSKAAQKRTPVPLGVALGIVLSTAKALAYCGHALSYEGESLDLLHHDISPHNIQIRFDGVVKLLDFGVATQAQKQEGSSRRGKFAYMSPEAFHRLHLDQRSDLFSLGVVLYELTMGRRLFKGRNQQETKQKAEACVIPKPRSIHQQFPQLLEELVLKALHPDKDQRFSNFEALIIAIEQVKQKLNLDCSEERVARYLRELYEDGIEERSRHLQSLAARAEMIGSDPLDEINTLNSREQAPVNLTGKAIEDLPTSLGIDNLKTPAPFDEGGGLFEKEVVAEEVLQSIEEEANKLGQQDRLPQAEGLPENFTEIGQHDKDWDDSPTKSSLPVIVWVVMILIALGGGFYLGGQSQSPAKEKISTSNTHFVISSEPSGAIVSVGGMMWGATPLDITKELDVDKVTIQLSKPGFEAQSTQLPVQNGATLHIHLNLPRKAH